MAANVTKTQWAIGGAALVSVAVLGWTLMRPTRETKRRKKGKKKGPKVAKFTHEVTKLPVDLNLVMFSEEGFHAHVAGDKKNKKLKFGARLFKINDKKVENLPYEEILTQLKKSKAPIKLVFKEFPDLEADWQKAEEYREKGNELYKENKTDEGIAECSKAIKLHPTNKVYYSNRVLMYLKSNQLEAALEDCQKIRELDPLSLYVKGHYLRGLVLFNLKKIKHAAAAFQTVMKLEPEFKQAKVRLDDCLKLLKIEEEQEEAKTNEKRRSSEKNMREKLGDLAAADISVVASKPPENVEAVKEDDAPIEGENILSNKQEDVSEQFDKDENKDDNVVNNNNNNNENNENDVNVVVNDNESKDVSNDADKNENNVDATDVADAVDNGADEAPPASDAVVATDDAQPSA